MNRTRLPLVTFATLIALAAAPPSRADGTADAAPTPSPASAAAKPAAAARPLARPAVKPCGVGNLSYAVFGEFSPSSQAMQPGMNKRILNTVEALCGNDIKLEEGTGVITLKAGTYHISGFSQVVYFTGTEPAESMFVKSHAAAGYARLWNLAVPEVQSPDSNADAISVGSGTSANAIPSMIDTYFHTDVDARIVLEHQCGSNVQDIYLHVYSENSPWHLFARLAIQKVQ